MPSSGLSESVVLAEWAEEECTHLDLIGAWELLLSIYDMLRFIGPATDEERLAEFKYVIGEVNKFLTRMKTGLGKARDIESAVAYLNHHANTADMANVTSRQNVAYNKLKQQWTKQAIIALRAKAAAQNEPQEGEEDDDR